jgi:ADP-heptose:LPS heptosyltransferase
MKKHIKDTTLVCVDCKNYGDAITAIKKSMEQNTFDKVVFLTDLKFELEGVEVIEIPKITSKYAYSKFMIEKLHEYIKTKYMLVIQGDGYILDGSLWDDKWFDYDYIGAPWLETDGFNVGNGGFSFRSTELMFCMSVIANIFHPEDNVICRIYRPLLETTHHFKFAPEEVAMKFAYELRQPLKPTFGFHGKFWQPYKETICIKRTGALGDVIAAEPVLRYFYEKGFNVALDTTLEFYNLFAKHDFPIAFVGHLHEDLEYIEVNLDMSYESNPLQVHLKTYFEFAQVEDYKLQKPRLNFKITPENKLFKKYAVLHIDERPQQSRNARGVNWGNLVSELNDLGYTVIQIGKNHHTEVKGAVMMATPTLNMLQYVIAGADLFIGVDSGPSHIAVAHNIPSVVMFGSVDPKIIHPDLTNIYPVVNKGVCKLPFCWHTEITTVGVPCYIDDQNPPCNRFNVGQIMAEVHEAIGTNKAK